VTAPQHEPGSDLEPDVVAAIALQFEGDVALYRAFAQSCATQFALDAIAGQEACQAADMPALRRLAHNLRSALIMLGQGAVSDLACQVEEQAAAGDLDSARASWRSLRSALLRLV
jgi:hypothetical protein